MSPSSASTPPKGGRWSWVRIAPREPCFWNAFAPADGTCAARCKEGDPGTSRLKGRLAGKLHHWDVFAEGRSDGFFGSPRNHRRLLATARAFARLGSSDAGRCPIAGKAGKANGGKRPRNRCPI